MSEYGMGMLLGIGTAVLVSVVIVALLLKFTKTDGSMKCKYDERQSAARGKAYKYGFFTFMACNALYAVLVSVMPKLPIDTPAFMVLSIAVAVVVCVSSCIWNDAYFSLNENRPRLMAVFAILSAFNLGLGISSISEGRGIRDGVLNISASNLFVGLMTICIFLVMAFKHFSGESEEE